MRFATSGRSPLIWRVERDAATLGGILVDARRADSCFVGEERLDALEFGRRLSRLDADVSFIVEVIGVLEPSPAGQLVLATAGGCLNVPFGPLLKVRDARLIVDGHAARHDRS